MMRQKITCMTTNRKRWASTPTLRTRSRFASGSHRDQVPPAPSPAGCRDSQRKPPTMASAALKNFSSLLESGYSVGSALADALAPHSVFRQRVRRGGPYESQNQLLASSNPHCPAGRLRASIRGRSRRRPIPPTPRITATRPWIASLEWRTISAGGATACSNRISTSASQFPAAASIIRPHQPRKLRSASAIETPGTIGRPGKCPAKNASVPDTAHTPCPCCPS